MTRDEVREIVAELVRERRNLAALPEVPDETPFVGGDLIDSLGFIELIGRLEERTGKEIDLLDVDPDELMTVAGLSRYLGEA